MRVLLTGASGLFGANFLWQYHTRFDLIAAAHRHPLTTAAAEPLALDITDAAQVMTTIQRLRPAVIVHAAAMAGVDACEDDPETAMAVNADGPAHLAAAAEQAGAYLIALSTDYVFDGATGRYREDDPPNPLGVYARTKRLGEEHVLARSPRATVVRTTLYGWNAQPKESFAERVLRGAEHGDPVTAFTDMFWSPILANDLAEQVAALIARPMPGLFHVAGHDRCSRHEFACAAAKTFGHDPAAVVRAGRLAEARLKAPRPPDASLDVSRFEQALGLPLPGLQQGLDRMKALAGQGIVPQLRRLLAPPTR
ncbi:MAG: dTDP-4-dehydrorhamnose reductase [Omnitrophica WOR_2 bacterium RIFCSPHIGHO2_02_FULL_68_15]|nr:MAG: dTDP-4-dehydrorhamnose reductase [Omnitrophica WOR_2 bacterium RIFCSPHIGHO2_02_FULL_68_15]